MVFIIWLSYYIRNRRFFIGGKLAENMYVSTPHKSVCSFTTSTSNTTTSSHSSNTSSNLSSTSTASCISSASATKKLKGTTLGSCAKRNQLKHSNTFNTSTQAKPYTSTNTTTTITESQKLISQSASTNNLARIHNNLYLSKSRTNEDFNSIKSNNKIVSVAEIKKNFTQNSLSKTKSAATPTKIPNVPASNASATTPTTTLKRKLKTPTTHKLPTRANQHHLMDADSSNSNSLANGQTNTMRRKLEITDIRLQATTNPHALCDGAQFIASDRNRCVQNLSSQYQKTN